MRPNLRRQEALQQTDRRLRLGPRAGSTREATLHDFVNGSGDPLRFEQKAVFRASHSDMMVGEARPCDFEEVHGFVRQSFRSRVTDEEPAPAPSMAP